MKESINKNAYLLMLDFLERTGVHSLTSNEAVPPYSKRYLWTDAFAVCNLLVLEQELAFSLIDHVHRILGKHRMDDKRTGWLSGLTEKEGMQHPTLRGLRIGKPLPERRQKEPIDEHLEWNRDGQYFHYLTKWMHALDQTSRLTKQPRFNFWAKELAIAAYSAFTYHLPNGQLRMYWKMSIDLSYPLVFSQGQHDPLDGYITYNQLRSTLGSNHTDDLKISCDQFETMMKLGNWETSDPLGIGSLLIDAFRIYQLMRQGAGYLFNEKGWQLVQALLLASNLGLKEYIRIGDLNQPANYRLAFRELGLSIGLHAMRLMIDIERKDPYCSHLPHLVDELETIETTYRNIRETIESFWVIPKHREGYLWKEHQDINDVMLATSLVPHGFLILHRT